MTPPLVSQDAQAQIEEAAAWWVQNRPFAPGAVRQDLDRILGLLSVNPGIGARRSDDDRRHLMDAPAGFKPLFRTSPALELVGPLYSRGEGTDLVIGLRVEKKHCNARGTMHGGMLATLADVALGYTMAFASSPPANLVTASLSLDFAGTARIGDWVEAHVDVQKQGSRLSFANCYLTANGERIVRASAVFLVAGQLEG